MKNLLLGFICLLFFSINATSQDFNSAVGLRIGYPLSVTYKKFISDQNAIEAYAGYRNFFGASYFSFSGAFQIHKDIDEVDRLQYYFGAGASVVKWNLDFGSGNTSLGINGYLGLSYTLENTPLNVSIDWIPTLFINGQSGFGSGFSASAGSLAVRYVLGSGDSN